MTSLLPVLFYVTRGRYFYPQVIGEGNKIQQSEVNAPGLMTSETRA